MASHFFSPALLCTCVRAQTIRADVGLAADYCGAPCTDEMEEPVSITDLRGRRLLNAGAAGADGLYVGDLPSGVYLLRCGEEVVRWVKR